MTQARHSKSVPSPDGPSSPLPVHLLSLPLLAEPENYIACRWDLTADHAQREYWLRLFRTQLRSLLDEAVRDAAARGLDAVNARGRADLVREDFFGYLDLVTHDPGVFGRLDIHQVCLARQRSLTRFGFDDAYHSVKARENRAALGLLPDLLAQLDALPPAQRDERLTRGIFAGNIFDLGAPETTELFHAGRVNFRSALAELTPRPWLVDHLDRWLQRLTHGPVHHCAVVFVDNAGCDVVLGMIPFARELLRRGTGVILTANSWPALNDVTHEELTRLIDHVATFDDVIRLALVEGKLELVPSGNGSPLIDLNQTHPDLCDAVRRRGVDLVVLEGMGRAIESNFDAAFTCDALKIAMIKDRGVAEAMGGQMFDLVLRFDPADTA